MNKRSRDGRDELFDFGVPFSGFRGFAGRGSLISGLFGGRDPFDDPFFRNPFGSMFESSLFGSSGGPFANMHSSGFLEHQAPEPKRSRGPIIEEINSDDEKEETEKQRENPKKAMKEPFVEDTDDEDEGEDEVNTQLQLMNHHSGPSHRRVMPQASSFTFQSSSVTYGSSYGSSNGAYYTSSRTMRTGNDGVTFEESKEADTETRQATHRISRGLHNKGHSITRNLTSDGMVNTMQTLHNLNGDELDGFENTWEKNARSLSGWAGSSIGYKNIGGIDQNGQTSRAVRALPCTQHPHADVVSNPGSSRTQHPQVAGRMTVEDCSNPGSSRRQRVGRSKKDATYKNA